MRGGGVHLVGSKHSASALRGAAIGNAIPRPDVLGRLLFIRSSQAASSVLHVMPLCRSRVKGWLYPIPNGMARLSLGSDQSAVGQVASVPSSSLAVEGNSNRESSQLQGGFRA